MNHVPAQDRMHFPARVGTFHSHLVGGLRARGTRGGVGLLVRESLSVQSRDWLMRWSLAFSQANGYSDNVYNRSGS